MLPIWLKILTNSSSSEVKVWNFKDSFLFLHFIRIDQNSPDKPVKQQSLYRLWTHLEFKSTQDKLFEDSSVKHDVMSVPMFQCLAADWMNSPWSQQGRSRWGPLGCRRSFHQHTHPWRWTLPVGRKPNSFIQCELKTCQQQRILQQLQVSQLYRWMSTSEPQLLKTKQEVWRGRKQGSYSFSTVKFKPFNVPKSYTSWLSKPLSSQLWKFIITRFPLFSWNPFPGLFSVLIELLQYEIQVITPHTSTYLSSPYFGNVPFIAVPFILYNYYPDCCHVYSSPAPRSLM